MPDTQDMCALQAAGWRQRSSSGYMALLGPLWARREEGSWAYGLLATPAHLNPAGIVHGGLLMSFIDHAVSLVAWEAVGRKACVTVQLDTHFLAAVRAGQFLEARARVVGATSSLVFMQGSLSCAGTEVATASALLKTVGRSDGTGAPTN